MDPGRPNGARNPRTDGFTRGLAGVRSSKDQAPAPRFRYWIAEFFRGLDPQTDSFLLLD